MHDIMPKLQEIEMANEEKWYEVTFKQVQPIHIGDNKHGVINETKIFIPGQTMWGALTNAYFKKTNVYDKNLFKNISCFYPKIEGSVLYPRYEEGEFFLGFCSEAEFRQKFTTTFLSTAINSTTLHAQDESLHEIDVILPNEIEWVGYVKAKKEQLDHIGEVFIGGDSRYGLGLMKMVNVREDENYMYNPEKGIIRKYKKNEPLTNFVEFENQNFIGELKLIAEFDFTTTPPTISQVKFVINVGGRIL